MIGSLLKLATLPVRLPIAAAGGILGMARGGADRLTPGEVENRGTMDALQKAGTFFSRAHWSEVPDGIADVAWHAPKHGLYHGLYESIVDVAIRDQRKKEYAGVVAAVREEFGSTLEHVKESFSIGTDTEIVQDIWSTGKEIGIDTAQNVFGSAWNLLWHPFTGGSYTRFASGVLGWVPRTAVSLGTGAALLVPDVASMPFRAFGGINKLISGMCRRPFAVMENAGRDIPVLGTVNKYVFGSFRRFFSAGEHFSEQMAVVGDHVERGLDRLLVPIGLREGRSTYGALDRYSGSTTTAPSNGGGMDQRMTPVEQMPAGAANGAPQQQQRAAA
jgi:hypothetical protein